MNSSMPGRKSAAVATGLLTLTVLSLLVLTLFSRQERLQASDDSKPFPVQFRNVTREAGLTFQHNN